MSELLNPIKNIKKFNQMPVFIRGDKDSIEQYSIENNYEISFVTLEDQRFSNQGAITYQYFDKNLSRWITEYGYDRVITSIEYTIIEPPVVEPLVEQILMTTDIIQDEEIYMSVIASTDVVYNWGDGTIETLSSGEETYHSYLDSVTSHDIVITADGITSIDCDGLNLSALDVSSCLLLDKLNCPYNQFTTIDLSNNVLLTHLECYGNYNDGQGLISIDLSNNTKLTYLDCADNLLTTLDISNNILLTTIYCGGMNITNIDISNNPLIEYLTCQSGNFLNVDDILDNLDTANLSGGTIELQGGTNAIPSSVGLDYKTSLENKGWTVTVNS